MTTVTVGSRRVRRKVLSPRGEAFVVELAPEGLWIKEAGRRTRFLLPYGRAYQEAVQLYVESERRAKRVLKAATRAATRAAR